MTKKLFMLLMVLTIVAFPISIYADEAESKTQAELIQDALLNGDSVQGSSASQDASGSSNEEEEITDAQKILNQINEESTEETDITEQENIPADEIDARIAKIDPYHIDADEVKALRKAYDSLTSSEKLAIKNYAMLEEYEASIKASEDIETSDDSQEEEEEEDEWMLDDRSELPESDSKSRTKNFNFNINEETQQLTIIARFVIDDNNDGKMDTPDFVLINPDGEETPITTQTQQLKSELMDVTCTWPSVNSAQNYFQMDIAKLQSGMWTLSSSIEVIFEKSGYMGGSVSVPEVTPSEDYQDDEQRETSLGDYGPVIKLGVFLLALIGGMIWFMFFTKKKFGVKGNTSSGGGLKLPSFANKINLKKNKGDEKNEYDLGRKPTDEELLEEYRKEYEEQKKLEEAMDREAEEENRRNSYNDDSDELWSNSSSKIEETKADFGYEDDYEDDDSFEEFEDHVGDTGVLAEKATDDIDATEKRQFGGRFG